MEFIQFDHGECPICCEDENLIICPFCHEKACKHCIMEYNKVNDTKKCLCPACKTKFNKLVSYMIFGDESDFFLQTQLQKYRDIITINSTCNDFYKAMTEVDKLQLDELMSIPNFQLLLSYYINNIINGCSEKVENVIQSLCRECFNEDVMKVFESSPVRKSKFNKVIRAAERYFIDGMQNVHKEWVKVNERDTHGVECHYIERPPRTYEKMISPDTKLVLTERVEELCPPRRKYLTDILIDHKDVPFDNGEYGCCHCETFKLDVESFDSSNAKFNKRLDFMGEDISSFTLVDEKPFDLISPSDIWKNRGVIVRDVLEEYHYTIREVATNHRGVVGPSIFNDDELMAKYYIYICDRIGELYKSKSKAKNIKFMNNLEKLRTMMQIKLLGQTTEQKELCEIIKQNAVKLVQTNNFDGKLVDTLKDLAIINSCSMETTNEINSEIRDKIYGHNLSDDKIKELDNVLINCSKVDDEQTDVRVLITRDNVDYEDIFGNIEKKFSIESNGPTLSFQKCRKCDGFIIMNDTGDRVCIKCGTKYCLDCGEVCEEGHKCNPDILATMKKIEEDCHKCPCCGVPIYRISGCNHMFCTNCHNGFDWATGKTITEDEQTNPLYFEWKEEMKRLKNRDITKESEDSICSDEPYHRAKFMMLRASKIYQDKVKCHQTLFARNLDAVMTNDEQAMKLLHDINLYKSLLRFTKHAYNELDNYVEELFKNDKLTKEEFRNAIDKYYEGYNEQCLLLETLFLVSYEGEDEIQKALEAFEKYFHQLYDAITEGINRAKANDESPDKETIREHIHDTGVLYSGRFNDRFNKCYDLMMENYPEIMTFEDVMKNIKLN